MLRARRESSSDRRGVSVNKCRGTAVQHVPRRSAAVPEVLEGIAVQRNLIGKMAGVVVLSEVAEEARHRV